MVKGENILNKLYIYIYIYIYMYVYNIYRGGRGWGQCHADKNHAKISCHST